MRHLVMKDIYRRTGLSVAFALIVGGPAHAVTCLFDDGMEHLVGDMTTYASCDIEVRDGPGDTPTTVILLEGGLAQRIWVYENSAATLQGGELYRPSDGEAGLRTFDNASATVLGGVLTNGTEGGLDGIWGAGIVAFDTSHISLRGGEFGSVEAPGGIVDFVGGVTDADSDIEAEGPGLLRICGTDFTLDGSPVGYGPLEPTSGVLAGDLCLGGSLDHFFSRYDDGMGAVGEIVLVPEPSTAGMLVLAMLLLGCRRLRPRS